VIVTGELGSMSSKNIVAIVLARSSAYAMSYDRRSKGE